MGDQWVALPHKRLDVLLQPDLKLRNVEEVGLEQVSVRYAASS